MRRANVVEGPAMPRGSPAHRDSPRSTRPALHEPRAIAPSRAEQTPSGADHLASAVEGALLTRESIREVRSRHLFIRFLTPPPPSSKLSGPPRGSVLYS